MIVDTMSYEDIVRLFLADGDGIVKHKMKEAYELSRKLSIKTTRKTTQIIRPISFKSGKTGLNYFIQIINLGANYPKKERIGIGLYAYFFKDKGMYAAVISEDTDGLKFNIYTPHFFDRYRERFLKDNTILKSETIFRFFMSNYTTMQTDIKSNKYPGNYYVVCNDGLGLATLQSNYIVEFKTFVTFDMLYQDQTEIIEEAKSAIAYFRQNCKPLEIPDALWVDIKTKEIIPNYL